MKKLIISILIPSLLLSLYGCSSIKEISKDEFIKPNSKKVIIKQYPDQKTYLVAKDNTRYQIYKFSNNGIGDTITILDGTKSINKETQIPFTGKLAVVNIKNFEVLTEGVGETALVVLGITAGLVLIILALTFTPNIGLGRGNF